MIVKNAAGEWVYLDPNGNEQPIKQETRQLDRQANDMAIDRNLDRPRSPWGGVMELVSEIAQPFVDEAQKK